MTALIAVRRYNCTVEYLRFIDGDSANAAIKLLLKQQDTLWAIRMTDEPVAERPTWQRHSVDCDNVFVSDMLRLM
jgi:hypothetical protein